MPAVPLREQVQAVEDAIKGEEDRMRDGLYTGADERLAILNLAALRAAADTLCALMSR
jgi:hypothetical protein